MPSMPSTQVYFVYTAVRICVAGSTCMSSIAKCGTAAAGKMMHPDGGGSVLCGIKLYLDWSVVLYFR